MAAGLNVWQAMALSALMFTGGSQFAFIGVIAGGGAGFSRLGGGQLPTGRAATRCMALRIDRMLQPLGWRKWLAAQVTIEMICGHSLGQRRPLERRPSSKTAAWCVCAVECVFYLARRQCWAMRWVTLASGGCDGAAVAAFWGCCGRVCSSVSRVALAVLCSVVTALAVPLLPPGLPIFVSCRGGCSLGWWRSARLAQDAVKEAVAA